MSPDPAIEYSAVCALPAAALTLPDPPTDSISDATFQVSLAQPTRDYRSITGKNIFFGPGLTTEEKLPDYEVTRFVHLTDITSSDRRTEAFLYDRYNNKRTRLRASTGFDSFTIYDSAGSKVLNGKVVRIDNRDIIFEVEEKYYVIHVGQNLDEAMRKPVATLEAIEKLLKAFGPGPVW